MILPSRRTPVESRIQQTNGDDPHPIRFLSIASSRIEHAHESQAARTTFIKKTGCASINKRDLKKL
jgi:hypothetical protein